MTFLFKLTNSSISLRLSFRCTFRRILFSNTNTPLFHITLHKRCIYELLLLLLLQCLLRPILLSVCLFVCLKFVSHLILKWIFNKIYFYFYNLLGLLLLPPSNNQVSNQPANQLTSVLTNQPMNSNHPLWRSLRFGYKIQSALLCACAHVLFFVGTVNGNVRKLMLLMQSKQELLFLPLTWLSLLLLLLLCWRDNNCKVN